MTAVAVAQRRLALSVGALALLLCPAVAAAQSAPLPTSEDSGLDFFRPPANLFQLEHEYRTTPGSSQDVTTETLNLRYDHTFDLTPSWMVITRTDLPLLAKLVVEAV